MAENNVENDGTQVNRVIQGIEGFICAIPDTSDLCNVSDKSEKIIPLTDITDELDGFEENNNEKIEQNLL